MSWAQSLVRISEFEVELLQKRLKQVAERRFAIELRIAALDAEEEAEAARARHDAEAGWWLVGFREGCKVRRAKLEAELAGLELEEAGARDALAEAYEAQKKYEQVLEAALKARAAEAARRESQALDELAIRRKAPR